MKTIDTGLRVNLPVLDMQYVLFHECNIDSCYAGKSWGVDNKRY